MEPIRILIVDDQRLMREGLRTLLELESDLAIAAEAEDGQAALEQYEATRPAVVLMDIRMPRLDGVEATRRLCQRWPEARVIILTTFDDDAYVFDGLRAGALGYLLKDVSGHELAEAVRKVAAGGALIEPSVARKVLAEFARLAEPASPTRPSIASPSRCPNANRGSCACWRPAPTTARSPASSSWPKARSRTTSQPSWLSWACKTAPRPPCVPASSGCCNLIRRPLICHSVGLAVGLNYAGGSFLCVILARK